MEDVNDCGGDARRDWESSVEQADMEGSGDDVHMREGPADDEDSSLSSELVREKDSGGDARLASGLCVLRVTARVSWSASPNSKPCILNSSVLSDASSSDSTSPSNIGNETSYSSL